MSSAPNWVHPVYRALLYTEIAFGLLANLFVLAIVVCNRKMRRSAMNLLIANLALADFLLLLYGAIFYSYPYIMHTPPDGLLISAKWVCTISTFFPATCWTATVTTFVAIAVERCVRDLCLRFFPLYTQYLL